jgi:hypothetical protein
MGMVICKKHGRTGVRVDVLHEICKKILIDKPIDQGMLSFIHVEYFCTDQGSGLNIQQMKLFSNRSIVFLSFLSFSSFI